MSENLKNGEKWEKVAIIEETQNSSIFRAKAEIPKILSK